MFNVGDNADEASSSGCQLPMTLSVEKIDFIRQISPGLVTLMTNSCVMGGVNGCRSSNQVPLSNVEYRQDILEVQQSAVGSFMTSFCNQLFEDNLDRMSYKEAYDLLTYFDSKGMYLQKVFDEADIPLTHFRGKARIFARMVKRKNIVTFQDLADLEDDDIEYD